MCYLANRSSSNSFWRTLAYRNYQQLIRRHHLHHQSDLALVGGTIGKSYLLWQALRSWKSCGRHRVYKDLSFSDRRASSYRSSQWLAACSHADFGLHWISEGGAQDVIRCYELDFFHRLILPLWWNRLPLFSTALMIDWYLCCLHSKCVDQ